MKEKMQFVTRVTVIHILTYILCGIVFMKLFHYETLYTQGNTLYFMRPVGSSSSLLGPVFQVVRGLLFGFILLLIKDSVISTKHGWLKLWVIVAGIGIFNTPGPAPCSIEGIIYTQLPLELHLKGAPEILIQTLLFSWLVASPPKHRFQIPGKYKIPLVSAVTMGVMFSLSGVILALILHKDVMAGMTDIGAFVIMFAAIIVTFFISKWYQSTASRLKNPALLLYCYLAMAAVPTLYNCLTGSIFASCLPLAINVIPVLILFLMNLLALRHSDHTA